jgi:DNA-binding MarR family transcriptional regulator
MAPDLRNEIGQQRPFDSLQQEAFLNLQRTAIALADALEAVLKRHGISNAQYNVLRIIRGAGEAGLGRNEIRDRLIVRMPDVTRLLDRLEAQGLVQRSRCPTDRRQMTTTLTDAGAALLHTLDAPVRDEHHRQLQHMTDEQLRTLIAVTTTARQAV